MEFFALLSLTAFSGAMVMDNKVKESFVLDTASAVCSYDAHYKEHPKYWCRGYFRDYCTIIALTPSSTGRVALTDTGNQLIVTVSCLTREDAGWYWCGIQRDFARDDMDFTELVVSDSRGARASDFWPVKGPSGNKSRSCRASRVVHKADHSRMSILIFCVLVTAVGIVSIVSHLFQRRRSQRARRGKGLSRSQKAGQASPVIPTPLKPQKYLSNGETVGIITKETPTPSGYENVEKQHFGEWEKQTLRLSLMKHEGLKPENSETFPVTIRPHGHSGTPEK